MCVALGTLDKDDVSLTIDRRSSTIGADAKRFSSDARGQIVAFDFGAFEKVRAGEGWCVMTEEFIGL